jgi:methylated-DNA-[protein]-cysteine S-methyltransferase
MKKNHYAIVDSPVGPLLLAADSGGLTQLRFLAGPKAREPESLVTANGTANAGMNGTMNSTGAVLEEARKQIVAYFTRHRNCFDLPLTPKGTPFQESVWRELQEIPYGETISYGELAKRIGNPKASRAVGAANGQNPISIVIPCHRVIGANGTLTGFGGGLAIKERLLEHEGYRTCPR